MKVYNLACHLDHHFEGWFASEADALSQQETGLLTCPVCDSKEIVRLPSAPRISKRASRELVSADQLPAQANKAAGVNSSADQSMVLTGSENIIRQSSPKRFHLLAQSKSCFCQNDFPFGSTHRYHRIRYHNIPATQCGLLQECLAMLH